MAIRIAVDAMGGDDAPAVVVAGALRALEQNPDDLHLLLFGPQERVEAALAEHVEAGDRSLQVIDAPEVIGMDEAPAAAVKRKQHSSIHLGLGACKEGKADAFVSAGNTGAIMAASLFILRCVPGVDRPSVIGYVPTTESFSVLLDVGTNVDCKPEHLAQFARMGSVYAEEILGRPSPAVGLVNVGEEPGKGNEQVKAAYELLDGAAGLNFVGNLEGRDLFAHAADVAVCDGFVGNIMLKMGEAIGTTFLAHLVEKELREQQLSPEAQRAVGSVLKGIRKPFDYEERGGAPLLGVDGNVMIGHGSSSVRAVTRLILAARDIAEQDMAASIGAAFT